MLAALGHTDEEEEGKEVSPPSNYEEDLPCILGAASIDTGESLPQLLPQSSPVSGASPRQLIVDANCGTVVLTAYPQRIPPMCARRG